jgi:excinuclease UvrABC nuclease subunit
MVIDGGPTQLTRAMEAAANFGRRGENRFLAKRFEEIYLSPVEEPLRLDKDSPALKLLQAVRDEATASPSHTTGISATGSSPALSWMRFLGSAASRRALLRHFGSIQV